VDDENVYLTLWKQLRSTDRHIVLRLAVSFVSGLFLAGLGLVGTWGFAYAAGARRASDEMIALWLFLAAIGWCVVLVSIWRRACGPGNFVAPAIGTVAVAVTTLLGSVAIDSAVRRDEELLIGAIVLVGLAIAVLLWLPAMHRLLRGKPVVGSDDLVLVHCPNCRYSLIGLRELRCPECGTEFTIDELIRAQRYDGVTRSRGREEHLDEQYLPSDDADTPRLHTPVETKRRA
jgi:hypothetical protein